MDSNAWNAERWDRTRGGFSFLSQRPPRFAKETQKDEIGPGAVSSSSHKGRQSPQRKRRKMRFDQERFLPLERDAHPFAQGCFLGVSLRSLRETLQRGACSIPDELNRPFGEFGPALEMECLMGPGLVAE